MFPTKPAIVASLSLTFVLAVSFPAGASGPAADHASIQVKVTAEEIQDALVFGSLVSSKDRDWVVEQNEGAIGALKELLIGEDHFRQSAESGGKRVSEDYPFEVLWCLAHIRSPKAIAVLEEYRSNHGDESVSLLLKGARLRLSRGSNAYGVVLIKKVLLAQPSRAARKLKQLSPGQAIHVLREGVPNDNELGDHGGGTVYDYVEVVPNGVRGYVQRTTFGSPSNY